MNVGKRLVIWAVTMALAMGGWSLAAPGKAHACSCAKPPAVKEELNRRTAVFAGKVTQVEKPASKLIQSSAEPVKITFEVSAVWKGELKSKTAVYTAMSSASCGYENFQVHTEYIVFATGTPDRLETSICTRTKPLASAWEERAVLGTGAAPLSTTPGPATEAASAGGQTGASSKALWSLGIMLAGVTAFAVMHRKFGGSRK